MLWILIPSLYLSDNSATSGFLVMATGIRTTEVQVNVKGAVTGLKNWYGKGWHTITKEVILSQ